MRVSSTKKSRYYRYAAIVLLAVFLVSFSLIAVNIYDRSFKKFSGQMTDEYIEYNGVKYELKDYLETYIVIGLDKESDDDSEDDSYNNNKRADFIMLFVFDNKAKTVTPIQINRDTMVWMNILGLNGETVGTVKKQLALSYNYGDGGTESCRNTRDAVSNLLNKMRIDYYMSVTMDGVPVCNDLVGGVTVEVLDDLTGIDDTLVKGQTVTLMGQQALNYVQAREGLENDTNAARMIRQKQYLVALRDKVVEKLNGDGADEFAVDLTAKMSEYLVTRISVEKANQTLEKISSYKFTETLELEGESKIGDNSVMEFYPDEDSIMNVIIKAFYEVSK